MGNNSVSCISVPVKKIKFILYLKWKKLRLHSTNNGNDKTYESNDKTIEYIKQNIQIIDTNMEILKDIDVKDFHLCFSRVCTTKFRERIAHIKNVLKSYSTEYTMNILVVPKNTNNNKKCLDTDLTVAITSCYNMTTIVSLYYFIILKRVLIKYLSTVETKPYKSESEIYTMLHTAITFNKDMNRCINSKYDIAKYIEEIELWNDEIEHFISYLLSM